MTVTEVARASGVGRETIRFYEQRGLLAPPPRSRSGYRLYGADATRRIRFIKSAQALGFTLEEISELLGLRTAHGCTRRVVKARAMQKVADIDRRIAGLAAMKAALLDITACCDGESAPADDCPILAALQAGKDAG
jgi:DNA-binding transcriptional MerR regulator